VRMIVPRPTVVAREPALARFQDVLNFVRRGIDGSQVEGFMSWSSRMAPSLSI